MSYNLQRELEGLPQRLEELEAALEALQIQSLMRHSLRSLTTILRKYWLNSRGLNRRWKRHLSAGSTLSL